VSKARVPPRPRKEPGQLAAVPNPFPDLSSGSQEFTGMGVDQHREIQELIDVLKRNNLAELEYERDGFRIYVKREAGPGQAAAARDSVPAGLERHAERLADSGPADTVGKVTITSPIGNRMGVGRTVQLSAEALDSRGRVVSGITFTWNSSAVSGRRSVRRGGRCRQEGTGLVRGGSDEADE